MTKECKGTVLLVDNEPENLAVLNNHLMNKGYEILIAENGEAALRRVRHILPDIILLDVIMPGIDGFETCRQLKANKNTKDIPILFMTVVANIPEKIKGFEAGAVDFITKPFQIEEVLVRVETHLSLRQIRRELEEKNAALQQEAAKRNRAEEIIVRQNKHMELAQQMARIGYWCLDIATGIPTWSDMMFTVMGCDPAKGVPHYEEHRNLIHPDDWDLFDRAVQGAVSGAPYQIELRIIFPDKSIHSVIAQGYPRFDANEKITELFGTAQDITERRRTEGALRESERRLKFSIESSEIGLWELDLINNTAWRSLHHDRIFGYETLLPEWTFEIFIKHVVTEDRLEVRRKFDEAMAKSAAWDFECRIRRKDGSIRWIWARGKPQLNERNELSQMFGVVHDITERKQAEIKLQEYSERLEDMVEERTAELKKTQEELLVKERLAVLGHFAGSISHEIRNPLAAIDSAAYLLTMKLGDGDEKIVQKLKSIAKNVEKATAIIESLLNLSRMEKPKTMPHVLADVIRESIRSSKIPSTVEVVASFPDEPVSVPIDAEQIRMALKNIIKNAVQAMDESGMLTVSITPEESGLVEISIADTGPGISEEHIEKVFEPLFSTKTHGIGFGLSIVKMIVENHGGTIRAESPPDGGASFVMTLPQAGPPRF